jgi:hypothetical protein
LVQVVLQEVVLLHKVQLPETTAHRVVSPHSLFRQVIPTQQKVAGVASGHLVTQVVRVVSVEDLKMEPRSLMKLMAVFKILEMVEKVK